MGVSDKPAYAFLFCCSFNTENNEGIFKGSFNEVITTDLGF